MKKLLFISTDSLVTEAKIKTGGAPLEKMTFLPGVFQFLTRIAVELDYEPVMLTRLQDPEVLQFIVRTFENEGVRFSKVIEVSDKKALAKYSNRKEKGHVKNSYLIGKGEADINLSAQIGCKCVLLNGAGTKIKKPVDVILNIPGWEKLYGFLKGGARKAQHQRITKETSITVELDLDGTGKAEISTGLHFFDHMLEQIARHGGIDLKIIAKGDLHIDEHHTIEDTAITLGETFIMALGDKRGIERYGFCLPMDEALAQVAIDFGGRNWIVWKAKFKRDKVGDVPTEMFFHFFKSFSDAAKCNLNIKVEGKNDHHKIEAIFKAFAKAIKIAVKRDVNNLQLPSTKGVL